MAYDSLASQFSLYFGTSDSLRNIILLHLIRLIDDQYDFAVYYFHDEGPME